MQVDENLVLTRIEELMHSENTSAILSKAMINLVIEKIRSGDEKILEELVAKLMEDEDFLKLLNNPQH